MESVSPERERERESRRGNMKENKVELSMSKRVNRHHTRVMKREM
jgi:hypothetical protein